MVSKYGPDAQPLIIHAQAMLSEMTPYVQTLGGPTKEEHAAENKAKQEDYIERLTSSSGLEGPAIDASERELILLYLREMQDIRDEENAAMAAAIEIEMAEKYDIYKQDIVGKTEGASTSFPQGSYGGYATAEEALAAGLER